MARFFGGWSKVKLTILITATFSTAASADFYATGQIEASECSGFVIRSCSHKPIHAVKDGDKMYEIKSRFAKVSEYNREKGRCWINTKKQGVGVTDIISNAVTTPDFYERKPSGEYVRVDAEYVTFKCREE